MPVKNILLRSYRTAAPASAPDASLSVAGLWYKSWLITWLMRLSRWALKFFRSNLSIKHNKKRV